VKKSSYKVVWDIRAFEHFKEILKHLAELSNQAPKMVKKAIFERIKTIQENPFVCEYDKLKSPSNKDFRAFVVFSYRVTYQIKHEIRGFE
jgi:mRNA-degrading endonuclease RelE of RelBE toxin-antitoxin system